MRKYLILLGFATVLVGCGASNKIQEPNAALDEMLAEKSFEIQIRRVEPMVTQALGQIANAGMLPPGDTVGSINVSGSGYFIKVEGDSASANLPFYGERQMSGGYNTDVGIKFNGPTKDLIIEKQVKKQGYILRFNITGESETFAVTSDILVNSTSRIVVQSSHRNSIRYIGTIISIQ